MPRLSARLRSLQHALDHPLLTGGIGLIGGLLSAFLILVSIISGNWQMGVSNDRFLTVIYAIIVPAAVGIASPLWYWLGRPIWRRIGRPGRQYLDRLTEVRFLPGIAATVLGLVVMLPVSATSRFWTQTRLPFGLLVAIVGPAWFWVGRPMLGDRLDGWLPTTVAADLDFTTRTARVIPAVAGLLLVSIAITSVIALPVVNVGEPVNEGSLSVSVTDVRTSASITRADGETVRADHGWRLLLVRLAVSNDGRLARPLPGGSYGGVAAIAPECSAQTFGEPSNNCNQVFLDGPFTVDGETFPPYEDRYVATDGDIAPDQTVTGWYVFRIEASPLQGGSDGRMVIVDDVGRWTYTYDTTPRPMQDRGTETPSVTPPG